MISNKKQRLKQNYKAKFATRICFPVKTDEEWNNYNRIIPKDVIVFETKGRFKIGNGTAKWKNLPFAEPLDIVREKRNPTNEDKYNYGTIWINTTNKAVFVKCIDWQEIFKGEALKKEDFKRKLDTKVDKVLGKKLSSNDYTDAERLLVRLIPELLEKNDSSFKNTLDNKLDNGVSYTKKELLTRLAEKIDKNAAYLKIDFDENLAKKVIANDTYNKEEFSTIFQERFSKKADLVNGVIPSYQLPSFVDDILEYDNRSLFPLVGIAHKIYIDKSTEKIYRWDGVSYVLLSDTIELGFTHDTAYPGDMGENLVTRILSLAERFIKQESLLGKIAFKDTVSTNDFEDNAITNNKIANNSVTTPKIRMITARNFAKGAVTSDKIPDNSVTDEKIKNVNFSQIIGAPIFTTNY